MVSRSLGSFQQGALQPQTNKKDKGIRKNSGQLSLFSPPPDPLRAYLAKINVDECSPLNALTILYSIKKMMDSEGVSK
jgi:DNA mismatch repair protein MutS